MIPIFLSISTSRRMDSIPAHITNVLVQDRPYWKDLKDRLRKMPEIKLGKYLGKMSQQTPHENAQRIAKKFELDLYVGYIITRDVNSGSNWTINEHSFCVHKGMVIEPTRIEEYNSTRTFYCGFKVPEPDIAQGRYLNLFQRIRYILEHSPLALSGADAA